MIARWYDKVAIRWVALTGPPRVSETLSPVSSELHPPVSSRPEFSSIAFFRSGESLAYERSLISVISADW